MACDGAAGEGSGEQAALTSWGAWGRTKTSMPRWGVWTGPWGHCRDCRGVEAARGREQEGCRSPCGSGLLQDTELAGLGSATEGPSLGHPGRPLQGWAHSEAQQKPQALKRKNP